MKKLYINILAFAFSSFFSLSHAQTTPDYGKVLYRVDVGGTTHLPYNGDTCTLNWDYDNFTYPSAYIDTVAMGRNFSLTNEAVTVNGSVPSYVPPVLFTQHRFLSKAGVNTLEYNFPVPAGQKVEVRLFFAETFADAADARKFDIMLEEQTKQAGFDIFAEVGKNVGMMKTFVVTSDGNLDVDFKRVKQNPLISGIEIIEIQDVTINGIFTPVSKSSTIEAYPNPFNNQVRVDFGTSSPEMITLYDSFGHAMNISYDQNGTIADINMDEFPKGIYYLHAISENNETETVRLIKE